MKNFTFLLFTLITFLFVSCKKEVPWSEITEVEIPEVKVWNPEDTRSISGLTAKRGLISNTKLAEEGYVLFEPTHSSKSFLINREGQVVHKWESDLFANQAYLLENSHLIRLERHLDVKTFAFAGLYGKLREYDWDGNIVWEFDYADEDHILHHDIEVLPNGNILAIAYEVISQEEAIAAGRNPENVTSAGIWVDKIIEIEPIRPYGGEIVWQWRMMEHLIQDFDATKTNYGVVSENPRKININTLGSHDNPIWPKEAFLKVKESGRMPKNRTFENQHSAVTHANAVSYNAELDQIAFSFKFYNEIYIVDHSTTVEESKTDSGGKWSFGGDLLYRWGNPKNYGRGSDEDVKLFTQHDVKFVPKGYPGEGNLLVFNNDIHNPESRFSTFFEIFSSKDIMQNFTPEMNIKIKDVGNYSGVYELQPPTSKVGTYNIPIDKAFGPEEPSWSYLAPDKYSFYATFVSGAQRLKNGNTLITQGTIGRLFEVTTDGKIVWEYWNPYYYKYKLPDGSPPDPAGFFIFYLFRSTFFDKNFPGFNNKKLSPISPQPEPFIIKMPPPPPPMEKDSVH